MKFKILILYSLMLLPTPKIVAQSFCQGFREGFIDKVDETNYSISVPVCPLSSPYCTKSEYTCGYIKGVEIALQKISQAQSNYESVQPSYSPASNSPTVFSVPDLGRIGYEIEAAKSPEQRQREAQARKNAFQRKIQYLQKEETKYMSKSKGIKDISLTYHLPNSLFDNSYLFTSIESYFYHTDKKYFLARINYFSQNDLPNLGLGYGWILSPYDYESDFEINVDALGSLIIAGPTIIPVESIRLSVFTTTFRNAVGVNLQLTMMQRVRGGVFEFSARPLIGFAYKRRFIF